MPSSLPPLGRIAVLVAAVMACLAIAAGAVLAASGSGDRYPPAPRLSIARVGAGAVRVRLTDDAAGVSFRCQLDGQRWRQCDATFTDGGLSAGEHTVDAQAVDRRGQRSATVRVSWREPERTSEPDDVPFTITGRPEAPLYPGAPAVRIALTLRGKSGSAIVVTSLTVRLDPSVLPAGCGPENFRIRQATVSDQTPVTVRADHAVTLPADGAHAPTIAMLDTGRDQDSCEGGRVGLTYEGRARR